MILVVDDSEAARALIIAAIEPLGLPVVEASHGRMALDLFAQHPIRLVITDDRMPVMSGAELVQQLREQSPTIGILMVTAYEGPAQPFSWVGVNAIVRKPFDVGTLLALAETLLAQLPVTPRSPRRDRRSTCELLPPP